MSFVGILHYSFWFACFQGPAYKVLEVKTVPGERATISIELEGPIGERALTNLAIDLRAKTGDQPETYITFQLPGMEREAGAWAKAQFSPQLKLDILGLTAEEQGRIVGQPRLPNEIGRWYRSGAGDLIVFFVEDRMLTYRCVRKDAESMERLHYEAGRFWYDNDAGSYMVIEPGGDLGFYDPSGKMREIPKIAPPPATGSGLEKGAYPDRGRLPEPPGEEVIARVGQVGVEPPVFTHKSAPNYPARALKIRLQGYVILEAILRANGVIDQITVLRGLGEEKFGFEEEAVASLKRWQFLPGKVDGKPADVRMTLKIDFVLQ